MSKEKKEGSSTGAQGRALLVVIALLFVAGLVWFWIGTGARRSERGLASGSQVSRDGARDPSELAPIAPRASEAVPSTERDAAELAPFASARTSQQPVEGKLGSLRGHIEVSGEADFPREWRLVLRPSVALADRDRAVARILEFAEGRQDFVVPDVPLGGYDVSGEAARFNGPAQMVLLQPGNEHPYVNLVFVPAGMLEGRILDAKAVPAEGVPVTLLSSGTVAAEVITDASGIFRFEALSDGDYELLVGKLTSPLMPERRPVRFMAPHLTFPDIELPLLGEIHLRVVDSYARPLEGVEVRGSGTQGGLIEGRTDFDGRLVARHLPAGHFRLRLEHPAFAKEYARRIAVDVVAGKIAEAPVRLGP